MLAPAPKMQNPFSSFDDAGRCPAWGTTMEINATGLLSASGIEFTDSVAYRIMSRLSVEAG